MRFWKLDGAGNDFVLVEKAALEGKSARALARSACDRRHGIGADGLLVVDAAKKTLDYYNADGSQAFCGNGSRCAAVWLYEKKRSAGREISFRSAAGAITARILGRGRAAVRMPEPRFVKELVLSTAARRWRAWLWDTGVPHAVVEAASLRDAPVESEGRALRLHKALAPEGANVDFIFRPRRRVVHMRTYERGVEGETAACGTGAVAAALTAERLGGARPKTVLPLSGEPLQVSRGQGGTWLAGPARVVFTGELP
jgi:diaminopimelate epimerase